MVGGVFLNFKSFAHNLLSVLALYNYFCFLFLNPSFCLVTCFLFFGVFRLQPVRDTREKQVQLWKELILDYCRTQKVFVIGLEEEFPLFSNPAIESKFNVC